MDYEEALAADFDSDSDTLVNENVESIEEDAAAPESLSELLTQSHLDSVGSKLHHIDVTKITPISSLTKIRSAIPLIRKELETYADSFQSEYLELLSVIENDPESEEYRFLMRLSELLTLINDEISILHKYVAVHYKVVFSELESLVPNTVDYCRVVLEIGQELVGIRAHEVRLREIVSQEKVLTIVMAALQHFTTLFELSKDDFANIREACEACIDLHGFLGELSDFIAGKLSRFAPNVSAIVGPIATSQLLISVGSLKQLAATPSCNLPSFGVKDLLSQHSGRSNFIRATGYLYHCPILKGLPPEITKQALRIISGKVVLAARVDLAKSSSNGEAGLKYLADIQSKIDKLLTPPERATTKALPVPKEQKSKKRGGRRFRKMKERFQMSELRNAQNKMEFGKEEQSVTDAYGEEIGFGMSKQINIQVNRNTDARMSKAMINRLQSQKKDDDLDTILLAPAEAPVTKKRTKEEVWGMMKKHRQN